MITMMIIMIMLLSRVNKLAYDASIGISASIGIT